MVKYCAYCGKQIEENASFCPFCSKKVDESLPSNSLNSNQINTNVNYSNPGVNKFNLKVMAPSRFFLYNTFTLGIYSIYWFYKNNKVLRDGFNKDVSVVLRTIGLFIPIVNWVMYYFFLRDFKHLLEERRLESFSLAANFIFIALFPIFGLNIFAFLNIQEYINDLCIYENPDIKINRKYSGAEIALLAIACIILFVGVFISMLYLIHLMSLSAMY